jgi:arylsulfatase A-like enzyme
VIQGAEHPNVVLILADDLGWSDLGCYGSTFHKTPQIDRLVARGLRFTNAYSSSPLCSPTRASIMTGLAPARIGITQPHCHLSHVNFQKRLAEPKSRKPVIDAATVTRLDTSYFTLAEAFKAAGYQTGHFGKWHLGAEPYSPLEQGFDIDLPHTPGPGPGGPNGYFAPWSYWKNQGRKGDHIDDRMAKEAVSFIRTNQHQPFFLNFWTFGVHAPWMAKQEYIQEADRRADAGALQRNPVYAAMIRSVDDAVGQILETLDELDLTQRTIIIFASDNGGWHNAPGRGTNRPRYAQTPVTSNSPLRSGKASLYEGGTRTPLGVVWPGQIAPGSNTDALWQHVDFFPTLAEACNLPQPTTGLAPSSREAFDGVSQLATWRGGPPTRTWVACHFPHSGTPEIDGFLAGAWIRVGDWKLIRFFARNRDGSDRLELYNLRVDVGEENNLAIQEQQRTIELQARLAEYLADAEAVIPIRNHDDHPPEGSPHK